MKQRKRILSIIIAFCFLAGCFAPVQTFAKSNTTRNQTVTYNKVTQSQNSYEAYGVIGAMEAYTSSDPEPGSDITVSPVKAVEDTSVEAAEDNTTAEPDISTTTAPAIEVKDKDSTKDEENLWYRKQNPMKKEHQKLLWEYCKKRELNYIDMLALIYTESNFNEKAVCGKYYGYFQISSGNCANLAKTLKTKNKPLDGEININWGTAMYSWILADKRVKNLEGKKKRDAALSIYQRGTGGYDKYGISKSFLKIYYKKWDKVTEWYEVKNK
ncbi:MAG: transglycosylase protein [Eubacterium sp.]|nr:transglycosylase protein [Eubacterium sp.]